MYVRRGAEQYTNQREPDTSRRRELCMYTEEGNHNEKIPQLGINMSSEEAQGMKTPTTSWPRVGKYTRKSLFLLSHRTTFAFKYRFPERPSFFLLHSNFKIFYFRDHWAGLDAWNRAPQSVPTWKTPCFALWNLAHPPRVDHELESILVKAYFCFHIELLLISNINFLSGLHFFPVAH